ncbi:Peptidoglycan deacetylase [Hyphodiscus hymeniophilus]|uniref:Peptidoglycan deacetylase n=1 Tax=Hyphodiscus hymeniophilus TaxID=353542 RepID=A0A9P6SL82_9HELO|nr:Peptidoglycan deacetylase [Hyphodiscus hymeniophilus]
MVKRVLVGYGIDVDAVSGWINTKTGAPANPTDVSRGIFGATVGIDRLLKLWDKLGIKTTWSPKADPVSRGLHGYTHEHVSQLSEQQQRDVLIKSIEVLTRFTGKKPKGWTAPAWDTSKDTIELLEEYGILYYAPSGAKWTETNMANPASSWMTPMSSLRPSKVVEIPANWHLDDWPPFQLSLKQASTHGYVDTYSVERLWKDQFDYYYREYDTFVFPMSIHPQVSGKPQVILMHERIFEYINNHEGVEWVTMEQMVKEYKEGRIGGVEVKGGVDL